MEKVDFRKELKDFYNPSAKEVSFVDVPDMNFLLIDGQGAPASQTYVASIQTLYPLAYTLKFIVKKNRGIDYGVLPLEALWWADDMSKFQTMQKDEWKWTSMIMQPKYVTESDFKGAIEKVQKKNLPAIGKVRFECFHEGKAAQLMHIGPYSDEAKNIQRIHDVIKASGYQLSGKHHEIYISNPDKTALEKLKTVIRQPMK